MAFSQHTLRATVVNLIVVHFLRPGKKNYGKYLAYTVYTWNYVLTSKLLQKYSCLGIISGTFEVITAITCSVAWTRCILQFSTQFWLWSAYIYCALYQNQCCSLAWMRVLMTSSTLAVHTKTWLFHAIYWQKFYQEGTEKYAKTKVIGNLGCTFWGLFTVVLYLYHISG